MKVPAVLAVIVGLCLPACGGGSNDVDVGSSAATTTTESSTTVPATTTTAPSTSTTAGRSTTTVRRSTSTVATTRRPGTTTAAPPTTGARGTACSAAQLSVEVKTDKATYRPGETVRAQATLRNRSAAPCFYASYTGAHRFEGPSGQLVRPSPVYIADAFRETELAPGATLTQNPTWDQQSCAASGSPCSQAPPGTYTVKVSWGFSGPPVEGSTTFRLVPA